MKNNSCCSACSLFSEESIPICHNCQIPRSDQLIPGVHCQLICVMDDNFTNALASFCVFQTAISTELHCSLINKAALFFFCSFRYCHYNSTTLYFSHLSVGRRCKTKESCKIHLSSCAPNYCSFCKWRIIALIQTQMLCFSSTGYWKKNKLKVELKRQNTITSSFQKIYFLAVIRFSDILATPGFAKHFCSDKRRVLREHILCMVSSKLLQPDVILHFSLTIDYSDEWDLIAICFPLLLWPCTSGCISFGW